MKNTVSRNNQSLEWRLEICLFQSLFEVIKNACLTLQELDFHILVQPPAGINTLRASHQ